jgi:hypothetical protein
MSELPIRPAACLAVETSESSALIGQIKRAEARTRGCYSMTFREPWSPTLMLKRESADGSTFCRRLDFALDCASILHIAYFVSCSVTPLFEEFSCSLGRHIWLHYLPYPPTQLLER